MSVPGHDERDYEFANKYSLEITQVVDGDEVDLKNKAYTGDGVAVNSDFIDGLSTADAKSKMIDFLEQKDLGKRKINYKLKDWLISRQRYWGTPIPIVYDPDGRPHPVPDEHLPWTLPDDVEYKPKGTSPLGTSKALLERTEKIFGEGWKPEIDTMDTFVCSSWYYLRYPDNLNSDNAFDGELINKILPVDMYIGGPEHATMHLLYARFITKVLKDIGHINFDEPFKRLFHQGIITKDGAKMSKSKGNTVSPDDFIENYGSDTFRCYLMFMGPYDEGGDWNDKGITGIFRFLNKVIYVCEKEEGDSSVDAQKIIHKTIKSVTEDLEKIKFNTALSKMMECMNELTSSNTLSRSEKSIIIKLLAPFAPHLTEELWETLGGSESVFNESWPEHDESMIVDNSMTIAIQVNGKLRGSIEVSIDATKDYILTQSKELENIQKFTCGMSIVKEIYVPSKLVNFVVK
jgi:leucyl-tRNA synthetase